MTRTRLLSLDAMRGVAAIMVLFHHSEREFGISFGFTYGYLAVDFFFLMSGFVIASAYEPRMDERMTLWRFFLMRLKRLYPMIALGALLGIAVAVLHRERSDNIYLAGLSALTMIPLLWSSAVLFSLNVPEWSIFFEIVTNLLHRTLFRILSTWVLCLVLILSVILLGIAGWQLHALANGWSPKTFWGGFPRAFFSYFMGVLIFRLTARGRLRVPSLPLPLIMLAFLGFVVLEAIVGRLVPPSAYWLFAVVCVFPLILLFLARVQLPESVTRIAEGLGDLSYPLYAVHVPLLTLAGPVVLRLGIGGRYVAALVLSALIVLVALLLDRIYDRPVRKALTRRRRPVVPETEQIAAP